MAPLYHVVTLVLSLLACPALASLQDGDIQIQGGGVLDIKGARGANLDVKYVGPP